MLCGHTGWQRCRLFQIGSACVFWRCRWLVGVQLLRWLWCSITKQRQGIWYYSLIPLEVTDEVPFSCHLIHPAVRTVLSEDSLLFTLCFKSTMWPSSACFDCNKYSLWSAGAPQPWKHKDSSTLHGSWSQGSNCRAPSAGRWLMQARPGSAEQLAGFCVLLNLTYF